ncbi:MAG: DNA polymerase III subunit delta' [Pseudomonadota bacterium]
MARAPKAIDDDKGPPPSPFRMPEARARLFGHEEAMSAVRHRIRDGSFSNGWLIAGPDGVGKATFAFQTARILLGAEEDDADGRRAASLIAAGAHPDLFVARRAWNEKTQKFATEISVDTVRALGSFLSRTAAMGGWRAAIVDSADELNRNAANALLKVLEEPPARAVLMLTTSQPGRLLATIRSRCRVLTLRPLTDAAVRSFLEAGEDIALNEIDRLVDGARGRPGLGLRLSTNDGAMALAAVEEFMRASDAARQPDAIGRLSARGGEAAYELFVALLGERLADTVRRNAADGAPEQLVRSLVAAYDAAREQFSRGQGLNLDRAQVAGAVWRILARADIGRMSRAVANR